MTLKPWYKVVYPREDLSENKPLDASEFAVYLDQVRDGRALAEDPRLREEITTIFSRVEVWNVKRCGELTGVWISGEIPPPPPKHRLYQGEIRRRKCQFPSPNPPT
jgi:hypothetical protein